MMRMYMWSFKALDKSSLSKTWCDGDQRKKCWLQGFCEIKGFYPKARYTNLEKCREIQVTYEERVSV